MTPQHLVLSSPSCYDKLGTLAQMNPPIRSVRHNKRLRQALKNNEIDIVGSDHAPHKLSEKKLGGLSLSLRSKKSGLRRRLRYSVIPCPQAVKS